MVKKYTELEIELYEKLTRLFNTYSKFSKVFRKSILDAKNEKLLIRTFIPKKFLILNELKNKDGN